MSATLQAAHFKRNGIVRQGVIPRIDFIVGTLIELHGPSLQSLSLELDRFLHLPNFAKTLLKVNTLPNLKNFNLQVREIHKHYAEDSELDYEVLVVWRQLMLQLAKSLPVLETLRIEAHLDLSLASTSVYRCSAQELGPVPKDPFHDEQGAYHYDYQEFED